jgi:hypothetical protein
MPSSSGSRSVLLYPEDEDIKVVRNVEGSLPKDEVQDSSRLETSA